MRTRFAFILRIIFVLMSIVSRFVTFQIVKLKIFSRLYKKKYTIKSFNVNSDCSAVLEIFNFWFFLKKKCGIQLNVPKILVSID